MDSSDSQNAFPPSSFQFTVSSSLEDLGGVGVPFNNEGSTSDSFRHSHASQAVHSPHSDNNRGLYPWQFDSPYTSADSSLNAALQTPENYQHTLHPEVHASGSFHGSPHFTSVGTLSHEVESTERLLGGMQIHSPLSVDTPLNDNSLEDFVNKWRSNHRTKIEQEMGKVFKEGSQLRAPPSVSHSPQPSSNSQWTSTCQLSQVSPNHAPQLEIPPEEIDEIYSDAGYIAEHDVYEDGEVQLSVLPATPPALYENLSHNVGVSDPSLLFYRPTTMSPHHQASFPLFVDTSSEVLSLTNTSPFHSPSYLQVPMPASRQSLDATSPLSIVSSLTSGSDGMEFDYQEYIPSPISEAGFSAHLSPAHSYQSFVDASEAFDMIPSQLSVSPSSQQASYTFYEPDEGSTAAVHMPSRNQSPQPQFGLPATWNQDMLASPAGSFQSFMDPNGYNTIGSNSEVSPSSRRTSYSFNEYAEASMPDVQMSFGNQSPQPNPSPNRNLPSPIPGVYDRPMDEVEASFDHRIVGGSSRPPQSGAQRRSRPRNRNRFNAVSRDHQEPAASSSRPLDKSDYQGSVPPARPVPQKKMVAKKKREGQNKMGSSVQVPLDPTENAANPVRKAQGRSSPQKSKGSEEDAEDGFVRRGGRAPKGLGGTFGQVPIVTSGSEGDDEGVGAGLDRHGDDDGYRLDGGVRKEKGKVVIKVPGSKRVKRSRPDDDDEEYEPEGGVTRHKKRKQSSKARVRRDEDEFQPGGGDVSQEEKAKPNRRGAAKKQKQKETPRPKLPKLPRVKLTEEQKKALRPAHQQLLDEIRRGIDRPRTCDGATHICTVCTQQTRRDTDLDRHLEAMIRQIPCGGCGKMYSRNDAIRRHRAGRSCPGRPLAEGEEVGEEDGEEVGEEGEGEVEEDEIKEDE